ncbi:hypothetical protein B0A55_00877 [Friedmanniomyces simplex]|uniref:PrpF protein n=1 Tax=Friedmanniomyces simplex TaxID=329884 RepID=A0A4U0Y3T8_9PEZI|nr:hypothetical protein B0A55_00877 [Friedmanniomyces simplex]
MRGGTSNGLLIHRKDLPKDEKEWQPILASAMGSPDNYGRQLNGMGSGISSTSKVVVVSTSTRQDADVDYTFVQVGIKDGSLDTAGNCGNMSSAVGPFAVDEGLVHGLKSGTDGEVTVRMYNTNTSKLIHSTFSLSADGKYENLGDYAIDGVPGAASRITLSFLDPGGAATGKALPTGSPVDRLELHGKSIMASLTDIANPGVFVLAADAGVPGVPGDVHPDVLGADVEIMQRLESIRQAGARMMGLDPNVQSVPKIVMLSPPTREAAAEGVNIVCRALSMQQAHKAVPLTLALNLGAICRMEDTLAHRVAVNAGGKESIVVAHASGKLEVGSVMRGGRIESALLHRTARALMKGDVFYDI